MTVAESHALCDRIEAALEARLARAAVTIHVEPVEIAAGAPLARAPTAGGQHPLRRGGSDARSQGTDSRIAEVISPTML